MIDLGKGVATARVKRWFALGVTAFAAAASAPLAANSQHETIAQAVVLAAREDFAAARTLIATDFGKQSIDGETAEMVDLRIQAHLIRRKLGAEALDWWTRQAIQDPGKFLVRVPLNMDAYVELEATKFQNALQAGHCEWLEPSVSSSETGEAATLPALWEVTSEARRDFLGSLSTNAVESCQLCTVQSAGATLDRLLASALGGDFGPLIGAINSGCFAVHRKEMAIRVNALLQSVPKNAEWHNGLYQRYKNHPDFPSDESEALQMQWVEKRAHDVHGRILRAILQQTERTADRSSAPLVAIFFDEFQIPRPTELAAFLASEIGQVWLFDTTGHGPERLEEIGIFWANALLGRDPALASAQTMSALASAKQVVKFAPEAALGVAAVCEGAASHPELRILAKTIRASAAKIAVQDRRSNSVATVPASDFANRIEQLLQGNSGPQPLETTTGAASLLDQVDQVDSESLDPAGREVNTNRVSDRQPTADGLMGTAIDDATTAILVEQVKQAAAPILATLSVFDSGEPGQFLLDERFVKGWFREHQSDQVSYRYEFGQIVMEFGPAAHARLQGRTLAYSYWFGEVTGVFDAEAETRITNILPLVCGVPTPDDQSRLLWPIDGGQTTTLDARLLPKDCYVPAARANLKGTQECSVAANFARLRFALSADTYNAQEQQQPDGIDPYNPVLPRMLKTINRNCGASYEVVRLASDHWDIKVPAGDGSYSTVSLIDCKGWICGIPSGEPNPQCPSLPGLKPGSHLFCRS